MELSRDLSLFEQEVKGFEDILQPKSRWLVYKVDELKSIETSKDESYSTISGITTAGKAFTVKVLWYTDNNKAVFSSCHKTIKRFIDNHTPKEDYAPYIISGGALVENESILKNIDTCAAKAPHFGVPEENVYK